jgi:predicted ferric reductase
MQRQFLLKFVTVFILLAVAGFACTIPFYFESPSMYYKTGLDKLMLRTGKIFGILTVVFLLVQLILISRIPVIDKIWKVKNLMRYHRINGLIVMGLALLHPVLISAADHFVFFTFKLKYWPEFTGILLLIILVLSVGLSYWQKQSGINYRAWRVLHKISAPVIFLLLFVHVFNVSRSFESGLPFYALSACAVTAGLLISYKYLK